MNNDLISRKVLKGLIRDKSISIKFEEEKRGEWQNSLGLILSDVYNIIDNAPTVKFDVNDIEHKAYCKGLEDGRKIARPTGEWEFEYENDEEYYFSCTNCNTTERVPTGMNGARYKFCPNCGAKMETKGEEE